MDALTPASRFFGPCGHERRSVADGSPCLSRTHFPPFCPQPPRHPSHGICVRSRFSSARGRTPEDLASCPRPKEVLLPGSWRELRTALAGSLVGRAESSSRCVTSFMSRRYGPVVHLRQLPTPCRHGAVAFGYRRVNVPPDRDFHPAVCAPSQAHECAAFPRFSSCGWRLKEAAGCRAGGALRDAECGGFGGGCGEGLRQSGGMRRTPSASRRRTRVAPSRSAWSARHSRAFRRVPGPDGLCAPRPSV